MIWKRRKYSWLLQFLVGTDECSKSSDWKEADASLEHLSLLCEGLGRETAFASNPPSNKTFRLGNQSCQRSSSLSDSSVTSRQLKMNSGLRGDEDLEGGGNSLSTGKESRCGGFFFCCWRGGKKSIKWPIVPTSFLLRQLAGRASKLIMVAAARPSSQIASRDVKKQIHSNSWNAVYGIITL